MAAGTVVKGRIAGDDSVDYLVTAEASQLLSLDDLTTNDSLYFNGLPQGSDEAIFIGSTSGTVADIPIPTATDVIRVYLMRNAARRDKGADYALGIGLSGDDFTDRLAGGPEGSPVGNGTPFDAIGLGKRRLAFELREIGRRALQPVRRHPSLGFQSPIAFERKAREVS